MAVTTEHFQYINNDWIAGEYPPLLPEEGTLLTGNLARFTFLSSDAAGEYIEWDGTGSPAAILMQALDASAGAEQAQVWVGGNFFWHNLVYPVAAVATLKLLRKALEGTKFSVTDASLNNENVVNPV